MDNFNVKEILHRYNVDYRENQYGDEIDILCPFHNDGNFGNAKINEETGLFNCFSCREGGNIYHFVALLEDITDTEAYKLVGNSFEATPAYNLVRLKSRSVLPKESYSNLSNKIIFKMLDRLIHIRNINFSQRWLIVCSYIKEHQKKLSEKQLLFLFSEFNKEIKSL